MSHVRRPRVPLRRTGDAVQKNCPCRHRSAADHVQRARRTLGRCPRGGLPRLPAPARGQAVIALWEAVRSALSVTGLDGRDRSNPVLHDEPHTRARSITAHRDARATLTRICDGSPALRRRRSGSPRSPRLLKRAGGRCISRPVPAPASRPGTVRYAKRDWQPRSPACPRRRSRRRPTRLPARDR
jgi:hypothetical protein